MNYTIYHIPGIKIGVSKQLETRMRKQGFSEWEVLEVHTDIYEVSDREMELQRQYGLPVDTMPYWKRAQMNQIPKSLETKQKMREAQTGMVYSEESKAKMSAAAKGNQNCKGNKLSAEHRANISATLKGRPLTGGALESLTKKIQCPHCDMQTNRGNMGRHIKAKHEKLQRLYANTSTTESN